MDWQSGKPPNEQIVEVEDNGQIVEVMAYYGRDGSRPHWRNQDGSKCWDVTAFSRWRHKSA